MSDKELPSIVDGNYEPTIEKEYFTNDDGVLCYRDVTGIVRDAETHKLVKGTAPLNPVGGTKKDKELKKYLSLMLGSNGYRAVDELIKIAFYDPEDDMEKHYEQHKKNPRPPRFEPTINTSHKLQAIKLLMAYHVGNPTQRVEGNVKGTVEVEHKMSQIAKLLDQNRNKLKLIKNDSDDVIDYDPKTGTND